MKCLFLMNGLIFNNTKHVMNFNKKILEKNGFLVDCLVSTWDSEEEKTNNLECQKVFHKNINDEYLDKINFPHTKQIKNVPEWRYCRLSHYAIFVNSYECLKKIDLSSYDFIVKSRTDLYFDFEESIVNLTEKNTLFSFPVFWGGQQGNPIFMNDHYIMGSKQEILDYYFGVKDINNDLGEVWNSEMYSLKLIEKSKKKLKILEPRIYYISKGWGNINPNYLYK